ncbi:hypothetical protein CEXT_691841 [Caerostris extrusa]|uniref:Uncharacterized protein n=1 Tax=Caerostris extrusa TaxID=172846 RepID=A0AAV4VGC7_CAEEX|nr:hypothetical protein CEXT_691841 [Caerostris extrusa]
MECRSYSSILCDGSLFQITEYYPAFQHMNSGVGRDFRKSGVDVCQGSQDEAIPDPHYQEHCPPSRQFPKRRSHRHEVIGTRMNQNQSNPECSTVQTLVHYVTKSWIENPQEDPRPRRKIFQFDVTSRSSIRAFSVLKSSVLQLL